MYVSWIEQDKILNPQLWPPKFRCFADQNRPNGDTIKMNIDNFQMQKWGSYTFRARKADKKMELLVLFSYFVHELWSLNCQKLSFFQIFADVSKKFKVTIAIYVYTSESSRFALLKMALLLYYKLELRRHYCLKLMNFVKFLLSQWCFLIFYCLISCKLLLGPL